MTAKSLFLASILFTALLSGDVSAQGPRIGDVPVSIGAKKDDVLDRLRLRYVVVRSTLAQLDRWYVKSPDYVPRVQSMLNTDESMIGSVVFDADGDVYEVTRTAFASGVSQPRLPPDAQIDAVISMLTGLDKSTCVIGADASTEQIGLGAENQQAVIRRVTFLFLFCGGGHSVSLGRSKNGGLGPEGNSLLSAFEVWTRTK